MIISRFRRAGFVSLAALAAVACTPSPQTLDKYDTSSGTGGAGVDSSVAGKTLVEAGAGVPVVISTFNGTEEISLAKLCDGRNLVYVAIDRGGDAGRHQVSAPTVVENATQCHQ